MKSIEELLAERKPILIELLWDRLIHHSDKWNEFFSVLEHWAERNAWGVFNKTTPSSWKVKTVWRVRLWERMSMLFWRLRHPKSRIFRRAK